MIAFFQAGIVASFASSSSVPSKDFLFSETCTAGSVGSDLRYTPPLVSGLELMIDKSALGTDFCSSVFEAELLNLADLILC